MTTLIELSTAQQRELIDQLTRRIAKLWQRDPGPANDWLELLGEFDVRAIGHAVNRMEDECERWAPRPVDIRRLCRQWVEPVEERQMLPPPEKRNDPATVQAELAKMRKVLGVDECEVKPDAEE